MYYSCVKGIRAIVQVRGGAARPGRHLLFFANRRPNRATRQAVTNIRSLLLWAAVGVAALSPESARADELSPEAALSLEMTTVTAGLLLPTAIEFLPDGRLVITEKMGRVVVRKPTGETIVAGQMNVDSKTEKGLLNVIASPNFATTHELVFYYSSATAPVLDKNRVSLIRLDDDNHLDIAHEKVIVKGLRGPDDHEMGGGLALD